MRPTFHRCVPLLIGGLSALLLAACPTDDDDDGSGNGSDVAPGDTSGGDAAPADAGGGDVPAAEAVAGSYAVLSITLGSSVLTTSNADLGDGVQRRVDGTLVIDAGGTYTREFRFFEDDVLGETETAGGTWSLESDTILIITEELDGPSRVQYAFSGDTLTLTRIEDTASFEVDQMILQRQDR